MTKYLALDTETTGLFDFSKPADAEGQPRMASIALVYLDENLNTEKEVYKLVRPVGWEMGEEASKINGLTQEKLLAEGVPVTDILTIYSEAVAEGRIAVAFNAQYDLKILRGELRRAGMPDLFEDVKNICVMRGLTNVVKVPKANGKGYKFPKLSEAYIHQFGHDFDGAHDALNDTRATVDLFRKMAEKGMVPEAPVHYAKATAPVAAGDSDNPLVKIGGNNPPETTPFEAAKSTLESLYEKSKTWRDGVPVDNATLAASVESLEVELKAAIKAADEARTAEYKPLNDAKTEIQERFNPLIGGSKCDGGIGALALTACKDAAKPWRIAQLAEKEDKAAEDRRIASEKSAAALAAHQAANAASEEERLAQRDAADALLAEAVQASRGAKRAEKATTVKTGLVTKYAAKIVDLQELSWHVQERDPEGYREFLQCWASAAVSAQGAGAVSMKIPGVEITSSVEAR